VCSQAVFLAHAEKINYFRWENVTYRVLLPLLPPLLPPLDIHSRACFRLGSCPGVATSLPQPERVLAHSCYVPHIFSLCHSIHPHCPRASLPYVSPSAALSLAPSIFGLFSVALSTLLSTTALIFSLSSPLSSISLPLDGKISHTPREPL